MAYTKYNDPWEDEPSTDTPITGAALDYIETGIADAHTTADAAIPKSVVTTSGDLIVATGNAALTRLAVVTGGRPLVALTAGGVAWGAPARTAATPANPTGTSSTSAVMMGLARSFTPATTGNMILAFTGQLTGSPTNATWGCAIRIRYGTGSAPANGDALTGTLAGQSTKWVPALTSGTPFSPVALAGYVSGLTVGTAYWMDVGLAAVIGGTWSVESPNCIAIEV